MSATVGVVNDIATTQQGEQKLNSPSSVSLAPPRRRRSDIILRNMRCQAIEAISELLAAASVEHEKSSWVLSIQQLRASASFKAQLTHRLQVIEEARKFFLCNERPAIETSMLINEKDMLSSANELTQLWKSDTFRHKLKRAADHCTEEECYWADHSYVILHPEEASLLQHVMIVAEDRITNDVVGFVEVAMLPKPSVDEDAETVIDQKDVLTVVARCGPTILNLVTSSSYRRQGIGKRLVKVALRYVRRHWGLLDAQRGGLSPAGSIGLYVDSANVAAQTLYFREGFVRVSTGGSGDTRYYLERPLVVDDIDERLGAENGERSLSPLPL